jgi:hypothetical protein
MITAWAVPAPLPAYIGVSQTTEIPVAPDFADTLRTWPIGKAMKVTPARLRRSTPPARKGPLLRAAKCLICKEREYHKGIAPDPGSCTRDICGSSSRTGTFFCSYTVRCRPDATAKGR